MADTHVISALLQKRAELDGELRQMTKRIVQLKSDLEAVDAAIRVFDPSREPHKIKPITRRTKPKVFRHGQCSRAILNLLRDAPAPMTPREIMETLASEYHLDLTRQEDKTALLVKIRNTLPRYAGETLNREFRDGIAVWSVKQG